MAGETSPFNATCSREAGRIVAALEVLRTFADRIDPSEAAKLFALLGENAYDISHVYADTALVAGQTEVEVVQ